MSLGRRRVMAEAGVETAGNDEYTVLLIHSDTTDGSVVFQDHGAGLIALMLLLLLVMFITRQTRRSLGQLRYTLMELGIILLFPIMQILSWGQMTLRLTFGYEQRTPRKLS